jgi:hypothetical protein
MKNSLVAIAAFSAASLVLLVPSAHAAITLPKGSWPVCASATDAYCIESVTLTPEGGKPSTLSYGASGTAASNPDVTSGKALAGRWGSADWSAATLGAAGYDGLFVDAHQANDYVPWVYVDVQPTLGSALAVQSANKNYAANLDKNIAIGIKLHLGTIKTGVTFGVGQDVTTVIADSSGLGSILIDGYPTTVPVAGSSKDCKGNTGKAMALVNQFQSVIVPQNDPLGFGLDTAAGNLYVGSNGTCSLSTPVWNPDTKHFRYTSSAPALSPDGSKKNKGFYHAVISFADAKAYWGLAKPQDAAQALTVSIITSAGGSTAAIASVSAKNNFITIDTTNFDFPDAQLDIALNPTYNGTSAGPDATATSAAAEATGNSAAAKANQKIKANVSNTTTITCVKGKSTTKVSGVKPICPKGYTKK